MTGRWRFYRHRAAAIGRAGASRCCRSSSIAVSNSDPLAGHLVCGLYPDHAARRRRDRCRADGDVAARPRADPFQLSRQHVENGSDNVTLVLQELSNCFASHGVAAAPARALGTLSAIVAREANMLAYIDGFWLASGWRCSLLGVALITRAPPGPFTPAPFGFAKGILRRCGLRVA